MRLIAIVIVIDAKSLTAEQAEGVRKTILAKHLVAPGYLSTDCWKWTGCVVRADYGSYPRAIAGTKIVHRLAYMAFRGEIPADKPVVRHLRHNRSCCNPDHLEIGTVQDNVSDTFRRVRGPESKTNLADVKPPDYSVGPYFWSEARFYKFVLGITWRHGRKLVELGVLQPDGFNDKHPIYSCDAYAIQRHRSAMNRYHTPKNLYEHRTP